jgi:hypothetical protein
MTMVSELHLASHVLSNYNLSEKRRKEITEHFNLKGSAKVTLRFGYDKILQDIFRGDVFSITHIPDGGIDYITELNTGDGFDAYRDSPINQSLAPGVTIKNLFSLIQIAMKTSAGVDAQKAFEEAYAKSQMTLFKNGLIAKELKVKWWIRDGQIQIVPKNAVTTDFAIEISPQNGLLNYFPEDQDHCRFTCELNPQIFPGRQILLKAWDGAPLGAPFYRVERIEAQGDTHGSDGFTMTCFARNPRINLDF